MSENDLMTPSIGKLAEALSKAQAEIKTALKDKNNPFFKSSYADLEAVWDACREPLTRNGLSVSQPLVTDSNGKLFLVSLLLHPSGEFIKSTVPINPVKQDPQSVGSAITYMKRFALSALVGVVPSEKPSEDDSPSDHDDDGNAASGKQVSPQKDDLSNIIGRFNKKGQPQENIDQTITGKQLQHLFGLARGAGLKDKPELKNWILINYEVEPDFSLTKLKPDMYELICAGLEERAKEPK